MSEHFYETINADLGVEFALFAIEHPKWMEKNIPQGAVVVIQTEDEGFNAWARRIALCHHDPKEPIVLVNIRELRPKRSRIVRADAEPLTISKNGRKSKQNRRMIHHEARARKGSSSKSRVLVKQ